MDDSIKRYMFLDEVGSTNGFAVDLCHSSAPENGAIVVAKYQTEGRGQRGKHWQSDRGQNALFSIIYEPRDVPPVNQFIFVQMASLAVYEAILELAPHLNLSIKWPNDIYVDDMKIGGMLIHNIIKGHIIEYAVIGVGINLNQEEFPEELPNATSFLLETGLEVDPTSFIELVVKNLDNYMIDRNLAGLDDRYHDALYLKDEDSIFYLDDETIEGKIVGVDPSGKLVMEIGGENRKFSFGELVYG